MKISTFIHIFNDKVWDALHKEYIYVSEVELNYLKSNINRGILENVPESLINKGIITTIEEEVKLLKELKEQIRDKQFQSLYLISSTSCNLDCDYCFYRSSASKSLSQHQNMSFDIAKKALLNFKRIVQDNVKKSDYWQQVTFYGGEPLLNKNMLYQAIPFARENFDEDTNLVINTNGVLIDKDDIKLFKDNSVEVQISLDGDKEKHDLHRKTQNGDPTYEIVINNMKKILESGVKVLPMITATDDNIDGFSDRIYSIVKELGIDDYAVNVLITNSFKVNDDYTDKLAREMLMAYRNFGNIASDYAFVELYNRLLGIDKTLSKNSCGSSRKITVFPNGKVFACQALEKVQQNYMGTLSDDYIESPNWECWRLRSRFDNDECLKCPSIISCGGGCATGSYNMNGSIFDIDKNNCEYTKKLFKKIHNI